MVGRLRRPMSRKMFATLVKDLAWNREACSIRKWSSKILPATIHQRNAYGSSDPRVQSQGKMRIMNAGDAQTWQLDMLQYGF